MQYGRLQFTVWDVGGQDALRALWRHFYKDTDALIYIIDRYNSCAQTTQQNTLPTHHHFTDHHSNDRDRLTEARQALGKLLTEPELQACPVLVLANKQDLPHALPGEEVESQLGMARLGTSRPWRVQACCATDGTGLEEAMEWLSSTLIPNKGKP